MGHEPWAWESPEKPRAECSPMSISPPGLAGSTAGRQSPAPRWTCCPHQPKTPGGATCHDTKDYFFFPAGNDNPSSVLKTILSTKVAPEGRFCAVGSSSEPGAPPWAMESGWLEGEEEEGTRDLPLRPAGSTWPLCPTSVVEVFKDFGSFHYP